MTTTYLTLEKIWKEIEPHAIREDLSTIEEYYAAGKADELMEANPRDLWLYYRSELEVLIEDQGEVLQQQTKGFAAQHDLRLSQVFSEDAEGYARVLARAADLGISLAEYLRRLVDQDLARPPRCADPSIVFDLGSSVGSDIASDKDRMLGEAIERAEKLGRC